MELITRVLSAIFLKGPTGQDGLLLSLWDAASLVEA